MHGEKETNATSCAQTLTSREIVSIRKQMCLCLFLFYENKLLFSNYVAF